MFWKRKEGEERLPSPKGMPMEIGMYMVVEEKQKSDWVYSLKIVGRPTGKRNEYHYRVFDPFKVVQANVKVKDWDSLDEYPNLILWEGYLNKETNAVHPGKFVKPSASSN